MDEVCKHGSSRSPWAWLAGDRRRQDQTHTDPGLRDRDPCPPRLGPGSRRRCPWLHRLWPGRTQYAPRLRDRSARSDTRTNPECPSARRRPEIRRSRPDRHPSWRAVPRLADRHSARPADASSRSPRTEVAARCRRAHREPRGRSGAWAGAATVARAARTHRPTSEVRAPWQQTQRAGDPVLRATRRIRPNGDSSPRVRANRQAGSLDESRTRDGS